MPSFSMVVAYSSQTSQLLPTRRHPYHHLSFQTTTRTRSSMNQVTNKTRRDMMTGMLITAAATAVPSSSSSAIATTTATSTPPTTPPSPPTEIDANGVTRLKLQENGWSTWKWRGTHNINYITAGTSGPIVLLVHGFGASAYHWRYLIPELQKHCRVFAVDVLGFGWSDKAVVSYEGYQIWTEQIADFIEQVIHHDDNSTKTSTSTGSHKQKDKVVVVGNSMGGYASLSVASARPDLVQSVVLLNAAGRFDDGVGQEGEDEAAPAADAAAAASQQSFLGQVTASMTTAVKRAVITASFVFTKQPARIKQVLRSVYVNDKNIDDDLVRSIMIPANSSPNCAEVFYRVISARGTPLNRLLDRLEENKMPLLLLWGEKDPWCVPERATQIQRYYPRAQRVDVACGHCPHDDRPELTLPPLLAWVQQENQA